ncbi:hypothetical protein CLOSTASPAR_02208 [[Clostridium] asparagiforme DSM 15981]|uniref:Uncharacterized protein n=1 Tax=[Clostridium] asparagiforme DSM 15981 TaxID=518636 RepID=C0CYY0_9FIRM|nr:hypothetical protein CLOSTASPAR_02208 [[Clostridium] asparagiforme DSM 15981]
MPANNSLQTHFLFEFSFLYAIIKENLYGYLHKKEAICLP